MTSDSPALDAPESTRHSRSMAPPRIETVDATYHVNGKAVDGAKLLSRRRRPAVRSCRCSADEARRSDWCLLGYSLMTTHYHLILRLRDLTLSSGFQRLNSIYARTFNLRHERRGALWQRRFFDSIVETDSHLYETIRYVALNAQRANACQAPEDWPWSNYGSVDRRCVGRSGRGRVRAPPCSSTLVPKWRVGVLARDGRRAAIPEPAEVRPSLTHVRRMVLRSEQRNDLVVHRAVRRDEAAGRFRVGAVEGRAPAARLLDDQLHPGVVPQLQDRVAGDVERALCDEAVLPEVAQAAVRP